MRKIWNYEKIQTEALKYQTRVSFENGSSGAYGAAQKCGILNQVCSHMEYSRIYWTDEMIFQNARMETTRSGFQKNNPAAYHAAIRRDILDQACSHMKILHIDRTNEDLAKEAFSYKTRGSFKEHSPNAYKVAHTRNILDKICAHMKDSKSASSQEIKLFDLIKNLYPETKKLRDRKVKIEGKPHIKGFDIDIFIPESNKGIEFDGIYWHSFKAMRASKRKKRWPNEDIKNYHQIKDDYFLSKGIQILHVLEEDWLRNKEECIKKTLKFLGEKK